MQFAGNNCRVCGEKIVFENEGKSCHHCGTIVHDACELRLDCPACGQRFAKYERPEPDPLRDAILPRSLRPSRSGGPAIALAFGMLLLLFAIAISVFGAKI